MTLRHNGTGLRATPTALIVVIVALSLAVDAVRWGAVMAKPDLDAYTWVGWITAHCVVAAILWVGSQAHARRAIFAGWFLATAAIDALAMLYFIAVPGLYAEPVVMLYEIAVTLTLLFRVHMAGSVDAGR